MYAGGDAFALINAKLRIYVAAYNSGENNIEGLWIQKYEEPLVITEEEGRGYSKRKHAEFEITNKDARRDGVGQRCEWLAVKVMIVGFGDALATDFYWEGCSILKSAKGLVRKEVPKLGCSCTIF